MRLSVVLQSCIALAALLLFTSQAQAVVYGDFTGSTVTFEGVQDQNGLFGNAAPQGGIVVSGDSLDFSPNSFESSCAADPGCPPTPFEVEDTLTLTIQANNGFFIEEILLNEAGDTTFSSFGGAFAGTTVAATVFIDIFEVDGAAINQINGNAQMVFTSDGSFDTDVEGVGTHIWTGSLAIDVDQILADEGGFAADAHATRVQLNLNNILVAFAQAGATASIEKKDIDGLAITVIPEPGTALLFGLGLLGLASVRKTATETR